MSKKRILFVCMHNSARSQMAEAWLNHICGEFFEAYSAGLEAGTLNPLIVEAMQEEGIDISFKKTQSVFDLIKKGIFFTYVITVCDEASAERCPIFPQTKERLHWSFPDPSRLTGTKEKKMIHIREIRDSIKQKIEQFCSSIGKYKLSSYYEKIASSHRQRRFSRQVCTNSVSERS